MKRSSRVPTPRDLRKAGRLIPFVGAGLSQPLGLPSWDRLIDSLAMQLGYDPDIYRLNGSRLQLAEYFVVEKGSIKPLTRKMEELFNPPDRKVRASTSHRLLAELDLTTIYTTNYDHIIERAFKLHGVPCHTIAKIEDILAAPPDVTYVVKFHGSFSDPPSLVLTESNYFERLNFESALDLKLRADTLGKSLLFVGYALSDLNIRYLLYKLHKLRGRLETGQERVPSAYLTAFGSNDIQRKLLKQWDVEIIELDPRDKTKSTEDFLRSLK
jgi:SIR2-like protein